MKNIPRALLRSSYRRETWRNARRILRAIEKVLPITEAHLMGSFTTKKRRPADVDFVLLLKTKRSKRAAWSLDLVIAPDNRKGRLVLADTSQWLKQKYGAKHAAVIRLS